MKAFLCSRLQFEYQEMAQARSVRDLPMLAAITVTINKGYKATFHSRLQYKKNRG